MVSENDFEVLLSNCPCSERIQCCSAEIQHYSARILYYSFNFQHHLNSLHQLDQIHSKLTHDQNTELNMLHQIIMQYPKHSHLQILNQIHTFFALKLMPVNLLHLPKRDINEYFSPTTGIKKSSCRLTNVFMMKTIE